MYKVVISLSACFFIIGFSLFSQLTATHAQSEILEVATVERSPFVLQRGTGYIGYSIELWDAVANELGIEYEVTVFETFPDMLNAVANREMDLAIANITITAEREEKLDFSHSIYHSGLQIMLAKSQKLVVGHVIPAIVASGILWVVVIALLILLVVAHLIWFFEWGDEREFHDTYLQGIWDAFWWSAVTVTTVGYGDKVPRSVPGRILALVWMFFGLFLLSVFVAQISDIMANSFYLAEIERPEDLPGRIVATIEESTADQYLTSVGAVVVRYTQPDEMFDALESGTVEAAVFDAPILAYHQATVGQHKFRLVGSVFKPEQFGIALQDGSPHRESVNQALLKLTEDGTVQKIYDDWFSVNQ
ncbi:MAG: transporter substrate-binding domain-containing protein [Chloroflexota bacterium]